MGASISSKFIFLCASVLFIAVACSFAVNIPNADDFEMYLGTLAAQAEGMPLFENLFRKHGEHFIATTRGLALALASADSLNFTFIIFLGSLAPIICCLIFYKKAKHNKALILASSALLLLNPSYHQVLTWAAASIEHLWVMPLVLGALYLADQNPRKHLWAQITLAALAFCTQGNGLFCLSSLAVICFLKRNYRLSMLWDCLFIAGLAIHLNSPSGGVAFEAAQIKDYIRYFLGFIASPFTSDINIAVSGGMLILLFSAVLFLRSKSESRVFYAGVISFVIFTAAANALARVQFGVDYPLTQSRYTYPALFLAISFYCLLVDNESLKFTTIRTIKYLAIPVIFFAVSWKYLDQLQHRMQTLNESSYRWQLFKKSLEYPDNQRAKYLLNTAQKSGAYSLPPSPEQEGIAPAAETDLGTARPHMKLVIEHKLKNSTFAWISGYSVMNTENKLEAIHLLLKTEENILSVPCSIRPRPDVAVKKESSKPLGFRCLFLISELPENSYQIGIKRCGEDECYYKPSSKKLKKRLFTSEK